LSAGREAMRAFVDQDPMTHGSSAMRGFRPASQAEVVLAFLRGEIDSDRFGTDVRRALADAGGLRLVRSPDLDSEEENQARAPSPRREAGQIPNCSKASPRWWTGTTACCRPTPSRECASSTTPTGTSSRAALADQPTSFRLCGQADCRRG